MSTRRKTAAAAAPVLPGDFQAQAHGLGLSIITYLNASVLCADGVSRWLPQDMVGTDGTTAIFYRPAGFGNYDFDGWEPHHKFMTGGRYRSIESALAWMQRAQDIKAGKAEDFRGC